MASRKSGVLSYMIENIVVRTTVYYIVLFGVAVALSRLSLAQDVMKSAMDNLVSGGGFTGAVSKSAALKEMANAPPLTETTLALTVAAAMLGAVLLALPVAWIYTLTRQKRGFQQSVVQTLMILPPLVAGVVVLVKYSVALAFSLAGIVAAVKFRNTLDDSKDAVYVFLATAIGLAAAVQLPVAAVISVAFNILILALWLTDFGKPAAFDGLRAQKRVEEARQLMRQTGSFVAMLDDEIFEHMTPEQLEVAADRAWKRRRQLETSDVTEDDMQRREVLLRIQTRDPSSARAPVEGSFGDLLKKWRYVGVSHAADGTHYMEYAVQLKKSPRSEDLESALALKSEVLSTEFK
ncbi:MAG TPA: DUF4956 domain-containing protein [Gemmatimonadaceae bacterium]